MKYNIQQGKPCYNGILFGAWQIAGDIESPSEIGIRTPQGFTEKSYILRDRRLRLELA